MLQMLTSPINEVAADGEEKKEKLLKRRIFKLRCTRKVYTGYAPRTYS